MKKGFTLIELLAVIVILAIIALIASPIIIGLIDDARKESFKSSVYGIIRAGELLYSKDMMNDTIEEVVFTYDSGEETSSVDNKQLEYNGAKPDSGNVFINEEGKIAIIIYNGTYCAEKGYDESEIRLTNKSKEECKITLPFECNNTLYDLRDMEQYNTVKITGSQGEQCWMAENLKYTKNGCLEKDFKSFVQEYSNYGEPPYDACVIHSAKQGVWQGSYNNWEGTQVLYQWGVAMNGSETEGSQGLCPTGWHIPNNTEWIGLSTNVGESVSGTKLKAEEPNWNGQETVGFNALPVGGRLSDNSLHWSGYATFWWSSSSSEEENEIWGYAICTDCQNATMNTDYLSNAASIRCILD